ncbi:MAG: hypothetical protein JNL02_10650, partial [Saprospiraceae bacterium]|nr:hypothetical protein [Saprospiraceae bacterium]
GLKEGVRKGKIEAIRAILRKHPEWTDLTIADLLDVAESLVQQTRQEGPNE